MAAILAMFTAGDTNETVLRIEAMVRRFFNSILKGHGKGIFQNVENLKPKYPKTYDIT